ncbi:MAG TPA: serine/threonine-protein kinase [Polyangiales bacterium]|nr:serine/threonine-protein kinase [Polyangiales bacterium]
MTKPSTSIPDPNADPAEAHSGTSSVLRPSGAVPVPALLRKQCSACGQHYPGHFLVCPTDATRLREVTNPEIDELIGSVLGDTYEVLRVIGEGGMGRVYEARHTRLFSKRFAIKVLHSDLTRQPEVVGRFLREAEATSALHHPNIVGALDVNQLADGRPYIVAELLEGQQLGDYFEKHGKLSVEEAIALCRPICQALIAAHDKDIVHRDIKPENLFVVGEGAQRTVKLLDFGISLVGDATASFTKTGMVMGTPAYMPPEQARGLRVDFRADIYAVGAILYEALTGKPPFERADPIATLGAVLTRTPAAPSTIAPEVPLALERVVQKAMEKLPERRFASMRDFDAALAELEMQTTGGAGQRFSRTSLPPVAASEAYPEGWKGKLLRAYRAPAHLRTRLWVLSIFAAASVLAWLLTISCGIMRAEAAPGAQLSFREWAVMVLGSLGVLSVGAIAWAHHLFWHVWPNTTRVTETLARSARTVAASGATYATGMLLVRAVAMLEGNAGISAWLGWDIALSVLALSAGYIMWWLERPR